jgi:hypothetical protein
MCEKRFSREEVDTTIDDRCTLVDGDIFIWNSIMFMLCGYKKMNEDEDKIPKY